MADAVSRITSGQRIGVFAMQHGPGTENAFGGVAQAYGDSVPIVVLPGGYPRRHHQHPAQLQLVPQLPARHQVVRAGHAGRRGARTRCAAPSPRCGTAARARCWSRFPSTSATRRCRSRSTYTPAPRTRVGARIPQAVTEVARRLVGGRAAGDLRRPGRALRAGVAAAARAGRAAGGAGHHEPAGQERVPGEPPAVARLGRPLDPEAGPPLPARTPTSSSASAAASRRPTTAWPCPKGKTHHPRHPRPGRPQQGHAWPSTRWSATPGSRSTRCSPRCATA